MKRLLLALTLLALPLAAADYTWTSDAGQETVISRARAESNASACAVVSLPPTCTQAEATAAATAAGIAAPNVYNTNQAWVRDVIRDEVRRTKRMQKEADKRTFAVAFDAATPAQRDALCVAVGLPAGCLQ